MTLTFPQDFTFGTATAAYQIEGAVTEDGRCPSIWDTFSHTPGATIAGDTGDVATDSYHRWREDLALLKDLGVDAYRFSIAVPRIISTPDGVPNEKGLDFYEASWTPAGGRHQAGRDAVPLGFAAIPRRRGRLAEPQNRLCARRLRGYRGQAPRRPRRHLDHAERAWCSSYLSYGAKEHAPGLGLGPGAFPAVHHLNLAHGLMTQAVRAEVGDKAKCSVTLNLQFNRGDADACHRLDLISNRAFLDPMLRGRYPDELFSITKGICDWDFIQSGDLELIHQPIDVLGINYYSTNRVAMSDRPQFPQSTEASTAPGASDVDWLSTEGPHTDMGWNIDPDGLHDLLVRVHDNYPEVDLVVTENGMACKDQLTVNEDGTKSVHDPDRIDYLKRHFAAAKRAIDEGVPLTGYFVWSLLDNFEWYFGYAKRFGITYVDYATQERIPKDSFMWYRDFLASRKG